MIIDTVEISNLGLWENLFLKFDKSIKQLYLHYCIHDFTILE